MVVIDKQDAYQETMRVAARAGLYFKRIVYPGRTRALSISVSLLLSLLVCDASSIAWARWHTSVLHIFDNNIFSNTII